MKINKKELQSFEEKPELLKLIIILATSKKKLNQVTMIQIVMKKTRSLMNYKELVCLQQTKALVITTKKKWCCMNGKKISKSLLGEKHLLGKPVHFPIKNTENNADTWGFIQQYFQHLYRTANSIVHLMVEWRHHKFSDLGNSIFL